MKFSSKKPHRRTYAPEAVNLSHVMGYVGAIDSEEYESLKNLGYLPDAVVGKAGFAMVGDGGNIGHDLKSALSAFGILKPAG